MDIAFTSRSLLTVFFRHSLKFYLDFGLVVFIGLFFIANKDRAYEARGSLIVKFGEGARPDVNLLGQPNSEQMNDSKEIMQSYVKIMNSTDLLRDVIKSVGIEKAYPELVQKDKTIDKSIEDSAILALSSNIRVVTDNKSNLIELYVRHKDPEVAAMLADKLMKLFVVRQIMVYNAPQTDFLNQQVVEIKRKLDESHNEFLEFKKSLEISDIDIEISQLLQEKRETYGMSFEAVTSAQTTLSSLEAKAAEMRATYREDSPVIKKMEEGIAQAREQLASRKAELDEITAPEGPLAKRMEKINERLAFLEKQRGKYNELKQKVEMEENNFKYYQQRSEEARVNSILNQENITRVSIVDNPTAPTKGVPMKRLLMLIGIFIIAGFLGISVVVLSELIDEKFSSPEQLTDSFNIPVIATFDRYNESSKS